MITAEQVKNLNKKIEGLNAQGTRAKAKLEVLEGNLGQALDDYKSAYGVHLRGKTMKITAGNIQKELSAVEAEVQKEFELREAVVAAIERGDIDEANRLLGVEVAEPEPEEDDEVEEEAQEVVEEVSEAVMEDFGFDDDVEDESEEDSYGNIDGDGMVGEDDNTDSDSFGFSADDFGDISFDDDEPEEKTVKPVEKSKSTQKKSGKNSAVVGSSVEDAMEELGVGSEFGEFPVDDDDMEDFGFGDMLSGTKFSLDD